MVTETWTSSTRYWLIDSASGWSPRYEVQLASPADVVGVFTATTARCPDVTARLIRNGSWTAAHLAAVTDPSTWDVQFSGAPGDDTNIE